MAILDFFTINVPLLVTVKTVDVLPSIEGKRDALGIQTPEGVPVAVGIREGGIISILRLAEMPEECEKKLGTLATALAYSCLGDRL